MADLVVAVVVVVLTGADAAVNDPSYRQADACLAPVRRFHHGPPCTQPGTVSVVTGMACMGWALYGHLGELLNLPMLVAL